MLRGLSLAKKVQLLFSAALVLIVALAWLWVVQGSLTNLEKRAKDANSEIDAAVSEGAGLAAELEAESSWVLAGGGISAENGDVKVRKLTFPDMNDEVVVREYNKAHESRVNALSVDAGTGPNWAEAH